VRPINKIKRRNITFHPLITPLTAGSKHLMLAELEIEPRGTLPKHNHGISEVAVYFISGKGTVEIDDERFYGDSNASFFVPAGSEIEIQNVGEETLRILVARSPLPE